MAFGEATKGDRWEQLRVELEGEANGHGYRCREACASLGEFRQKLAEMRRDQRRPWRVLVVDDEESILDLLKLNLEHTRRYRVAIQHKPDDVLRSVEEFDPDLIIMDVVMQGKDGLELARSIKNIEIRSELPIIMLTALLDAGVAHAVMHDGLLYLSKPIGIRELVHCIEMQLSDEAPVASGNPIPPCFKRPLP